jgi:large subunit ribosomal protein L9
LGQNDNVQWEQRVDSPADSENSHKFYILKIYDNVEHFAISWYYVPSLLSLTYPCLIKAFQEHKRGISIMNVYMLKDVEKVGMAGQVVKVADGYAINFLIPRKLAVKVEKNEASFYSSKVKKTQVEKQVLTSKIAMLAERIRNMHLTIKKRVHDEDKLYGSIGADDIVMLLKEKDVNINKKQVEFTKAIRTVGEHKVIIRLSAKLRPELSLKVTAE